MALEALKAVSSRRNFKSGVLQCAYFTDQREEATCLIMAGVQSLNSHSSLLPPNPVPFPKE